MSGLGSVLEQETARAEQDRLDGEALRRLVAAMPDTTVISISRSDESGHYRIKTPYAWYARDTIAAASDACREALEAQR